MSLQVWLPLNGDLTQQGASGITIVNNGATVNTSGKIGSCYAFNGSTGYIALSGNDLFKIFAGGTQQFSITMWVFHADTTRAILFGDYATSGGIGFNIELSTAHGVRFYWNGSPDTYPANATVAASGWTHVALTYDGTKLQSYINGVEKGSWSGTLATKNKTSGEFRLGRDNRSDSTAFNGRMNDFRIYDHALSAAEVKEISQGLVLHYKLDSIGPNFGNPNLLLEGMTPTAAGNGATGVVRSIEDGVQKIVADNPNSNWCTFGNHNTTLTLTKGDTFTFSLMIRSPDSDKKPTVYFQSGLGYYGMQGTMNNNWSIIYYTGTWSIDNLQTNIHLGFSSAPGTYYIKYFKLEKGGFVTPWAPKEGEALSDLKYIEDSSGYNHNGSILGDVKIASDTARYQSSVDLLTASTAINCGRGGMITDSITVNMWLKSSAWNNPVSCTEGGGWNFEASGDYFRFPIYISGVGYKYGQSTTTRAQLCNNQWHMLTGIYDRINQKVQIYVDGKLDNDYAAETSNNIGYNGSNVIWIGAEASGSNTAPNNYGMRGLFSDFRIYATALDADAIRQLYNVGAKVDNKQNLHTFEINELSSNMFRSELIMPWAKPNRTRIGEIVEHNGYMALNIAPEPFYNNISSSTGGALDGMFQAGSYVFDIWVDVDSVISGGTNRGGGMVIRYSDNTAENAFVFTGGNLGYQHKIYITPANKTVQRLEFYYYTSTDVFYRIDSCIYPINATKIFKSGIVQSSGFLEDTKTRIIKNSLIETNEIIEL